MEIDYAKSIIKKYDEQKKQINGDGLKKVTLQFGNENDRLENKRLLKEA